MRKSQSIIPSLVLLAASFAAAGACNSKSSGGSGPETNFDSGELDVTFAEDSSTPADAALTCPDAGVLPDGACNSLEQLDTTPVSGTCGTGAQPTGTGGTIADGTYVLTAQARYLDAGCTAGVTFEATIQITGGCFQRVDGEGASEILRSGNFTTTGNVITRDITCGPTLPAATYTATATQLTIFDEGGSVTTWTKQ